MGEAKESCAAMVIAAQSGFIHFEKLLESKQENV